jgi:hypothetical protein
MIDVTVSVSDFNLDMRAVRDDQLPFAFKNALNDVGLNIQTQERRHMHDVFNVRREDWLDRSVKITHFASKSDLFVNVGIHPPGVEGEGRKDVLTKFETDHEKKPFKGKFVAVPTGAKRTKKDIVRAAQRPAAFNFHREGKRILGDNRTFIVHKGPDVALILQRVGKGRRSQVRSLYLLLRSVDIEPDLLFEQNALGVVTRDIEAAFTRRLEEAMQSAR